MLPRMKPPSASQILREKFARNSRTNLNTNFPTLRDISPSCSERSRSPSVKRKAEFSFAQITKRNTNSERTTNRHSDNSNLLNRFEELDAAYATVTSICEKTAANVRDIENPEISALLTGRIHAISVLNEGQKSLTAAIKIVHTPEEEGHDGPQRPSMTTLGETASRTLRQKPASLTPLVRQDPISDWCADSVQEEPIPKAEDPVTKKKRIFKEAVKSAEKSTLIFNLDMGKTPIMNPKTILANSTMALINMAAKVEKKTPERMSQEIVDQIDDALSMASNVSFFGNSTKTYRNQSDPLSGSFCTVPVKYDFKDRDTRARVEQLLRSKCNINCSVPYPPILRACIKQVIAAGKSVLPNQYVRVNVDANKLALKLAWKAPGSGSWTFYPTEIPLPEAALDVESRTIPVDLQVTNLPASSPLITVSGSDSGGGGGPNASTVPQDNTAGASQAQA